MNTKRGMFNFNLIEKNISKIDNCYEQEKKLEAKIKTINDTYKSAYTSSNSTLLKSKNTMIENAIHVKAKNIRSYKLYAQKYVLIYKDANRAAIRDSSDAFNT